MLANSVNGIICRKRLQAAKPLVCHGPLGKQDETSHEVSSRHNKVEYFSNIYYILLKDVPEQE